MARKTKEEAERTYHALLDAAALLFTCKGVSQTTLNDIAKEAGMTRGAVYWHFDNKDAVVQALWERNANTLHECFYQNLINLGEKDPAGAFRVAVKTLIDTVIREPEVGQVIRIVLHNVEFTDDQTPLQCFLAEKKVQVLNATTSAFVTLQRYNSLKVELSSEVLGYGLLSYLLGLIQTSLSPLPNPVDLSTNGDELIDLYLDAILK